MPAIIQYYNVTFILILKTECDKRCFEIFKKQNAKLEASLLQITRWCEMHNISYTTKFYWRKKYPVCANLWNLYTYLRFCMEHKVGTTLFNRGE